MCAYVSRVGLGCVCVCVCEFACARVIVRSSASQMGTTFSLVRRILYTGVWGLEHVLDVLATYVSLAEGMCSSTDVMREREA